MNSALGLLAQRSGPGVPPYPPNLAVMISRNAGAFPERGVLEDVQGGVLRTFTWGQLEEAVGRLQGGLLRLGVKPGDRVAVLSPNRAEMLLLELAVMAMGAVWVPIFPGYAPDQARDLVTFCDPALVVVAGPPQLRKIEGAGPFPSLLSFDPAEGAHDFSSLLNGPAGPIQGSEITPGTTCLMMYTSGTMGRPKCVQLTHGNILSQQAAMETLWRLGPEDRILSYLPWHHSFGGIFEKYAALCSGALLALDPASGKNIDILLESWRRVRPTVFFSVPRVYQFLATRMIQDPALEEDIFHPGLRFVFTAAAPLPKSISDLFAARGIPVHEGWGLTETSPCCTVTDPARPRDPGVVGEPIPGVTVALAEDGEILVKGPNVMTGYFRNPEATEAVLRPGGWFATGDVGEFAEGGLRLISRKDRLFKLSNAEKVAPSEIENRILERCCFLSHVFVAGSGQSHPVALLFPNQALFADQPDPTRLHPGCSCPNCLEDMAHCLPRCLREVNAAFEAKYLRPQAVMLLDRQLSVETGELTPSLKLAPGVVGRAFKAHLERLYGQEGQEDLGEVHVLLLEGP